MWGKDMEKIRVKRMILAGSVILAVLAGCLIYCEKEEETEEGNSYGRQLSIGGELQWETEFGWIYTQKEEEGENGETGYFVPAAIEDGNYGTFETIAVCRMTLSEEDFFACIESYAKRLREKYTEEKILYQINGDAGIDQFVQLDSEKEHYLFIRLQDSVYILSGEMEKKTWRTFFTAWLFHTGLKWDGVQVMEQERYVWYDRMDHGARIMLHWEGGWLPVDGDVILFHKKEDGFYLKKKF